jgi:hypothetical protein
MGGRWSGDRVGRRGRTLRPDWSRRRMVALVIGVAGLVILLAWGLILSLLTVIPSKADRRGHLTVSGAPTTSVAVSPQAAAAARDELAARPMPTPSAAAVDVYRPWMPAPLSTRDPGAGIVLPPARRMDRLGVATGFPRTPQGAIAQLAAIDQVALQSASLPGIRAVIAEWAASDGPTPTTWSGVKAMAGLLNAAGLPGSGSPSLNLVATPAMGLIKGIVGDDFAVVCVDFAVEVTLDQTRSAAVADCQRMLWQEGRWVIGPGAEPAEAESVWPDTDAAYDVGFRDLVHE